MNRRSFAKSVIAVPALLGAPLSGYAAIVRRSHLHVAVIGAGAFGGWTALHLLRSGAKVTLIDSWGPGNARASSGGETRVTRYAYPKRIYVDMVARALEIWEENEARWGRKILHRSGVVFAGPDVSAFGRDARPHLEAAGVAFEYLDNSAIARRYPQMNPEGLDWGIYEPTTGYLLAREGCRAVVEAFLEEGGAFRVAHAAPGRISQGEMEPVRLSDGSTLQADRYVFACGPWLGKLFPDVLGSRIKPTRQEVFYFGEPPGGAPYRDFPVWADFGERVWYGIAGNEHRGFKVADDTSGPEFDPTSGERSASEAGLHRARRYLEYRFPGMMGAPLLEARVCQYEASTDSDFIVDRHPHAGNVWFAGGGSGHGYKHGATLGEHVAAAVLEKERVDPTFRLSRFNP